MSRIGKLPIPIPAGVTPTITGQHLVIHGPKGELTIDLHPRVQAKIVDQTIQIGVSDENNQTNRALWGLSRALVANMVTGVTTGFSKKLEINGVGFRATVSGSKIVLNLGFSHPIEFDIPAGITATVEKNVLTIAGLDKQLVGETAATIRSYKKPEPYKGKGIKYADEVIRRKAGKVVKAAGAK